MRCEFITQLSKLKKSSAESIENTKDFNNFKEYLHVERSVERDLRILLNEINRNQNKCLILLCGSAGDGKSHLLSYMKNSDKEELLCNYELYNDATESSEPTLTSIDTLAHKLVNFDDDHYNIQDGKRMIIAINLGTLNNFIESEKGKMFSKLREYVKENGILSSYIQEREYQHNSVFQHINFADYQIFSLNENGIQTDFLEKLLDKIFSNKDENPFYESYKNCKICPLRKRCTVCHNFEFLSDHKHQKALIYRIVQTVVIDKTIVATRDILNLLYDLIVHPDFDENKIRIGSLGVQFLENYINWTSPMLLNEYDDISPLINTIKNHDVLKNRTSKADEDAIIFYSAENINEIFKNAIKETPYRVLNDILDDLSDIVRDKQDLKKILYKFIVRLSSMKDKSEKSIKEIQFHEYLNYLYYQNIGNERNLAHIYESTKNAILNWNGEFGSEYICIDESNEYYWILEELKIKPVINKNNIQTDREIERFNPVVNLRYKKDSDNSSKIVNIKIDFTLYELISNIKKGYLPTTQDKNHHTDFASFVNELIEFGNKEKRVTIVSKNNDEKHRIIFEENDFGFEFKVVE